MEYDHLIIGSGYVGSYAAECFYKQKKQVAGISRTAEGGKNLRRLGIRHLCCDITKPEHLNGFPSAKYVLIATSPHERSLETYESIYRKGVQNILSRMETGPAPERLIYLSSTGVFGNRAGEWVNEATTVNPDSERSAILLAAETAVLNSKIDSVVFRLGGIYGPSRNRLRAFQDENWPREDEQDGFLNLMHREDIMLALPFLFEKAEPNQVYHGVDDFPFLKSELCDWLSAELSRRPKHRIQKASSLTGKRCRNDKLKALGMKLTYPSFREGYQDLIKSECPSSHRNRSGFAN